MRDRSLQADLGDPRCPQMTYHKRLTHLAGELTGCESHGGSQSLLFLKEESRLVGQAS